MIKECNFTDYFEVRFNDNLSKRKYNLMLLKCEVYDTIYDDVIMNRIIVDEKIIKLIDDSVTLFVFKPMMKISDNVEDIMEDYSFSELSIIVEDKKSPYGNYINSNKVVVLLCDDKKLFSKIKLLN